MSIEKEKGTSQSTVKVANKYLTVAYYKKDVFRTFPSFNAVFSIFFGNETSKLSFKIQVVFHLTVTTYSCTCRTTLIIR